VWWWPSASEECDVHLDFREFLLRLSDILGDVMWVAGRWDEGGVVDYDNIFGCHQGLWERAGSRLLLIE
jgi:hypothetical protein